MKNQTFLGDCLRWRCSCVVRKATEEDEEKGGGVSSKKPDVIPAPFVSASSQRLRPKALTLRPDSTDARTRIPRGSSYLIPSVSQSVWRQSAGVLIFSLEGGRERKCSWNVMIMWFMGERWRGCHHWRKPPFGAATGGNLVTPWKAEQRIQANLFKSSYWISVLRAHCWVQWLFLSRVSR